ncbi:hypothetical protein KJ575_02660 [Patescibacteria group bacterium]|nr:hypothetical protein [Patescibacteria group bacterium]
MPNKLKELSDKEREALDLLKSNIEEWLEAQLVEEIKGLSSNPTLADIQKAVFNELGEEEINPSKHRPLLVRALKEVVAEY